MDDETIKALNKFSEDLQEIVGEDLARSIINYAQRPNELEAEFLRSDGFAVLEEPQRNAVIDLLDHYLSSR